MIMIIKDNSVFRYGFLGMKDAFTTQFQPLGPTKSLLLEQLRVKSFGKIFLSKKEIRFEVLELEVQRFIGSAQGQYLLK